MDEQAKLLEENWFLRARVNSLVSSLESVTRLANAGCSVDGIASFVQVDLRNHKELVAAEKQKGTSTDG